MRDAYYYNGGLRVPVRIAESARVLKESGERIAPQPPGWRTFPLEDGLRLVVQQEVLEERSATDLGTVSQSILEHEKQGVAERALIQSPPQAELAGMVTFPIVIGEGEGLLFSSGDVVAAIPPTADQGWLDGICQEEGWRVERPLGFVRGGYVLSPENAGDPLEFANRLIERYGCTFAQPVFLEDIPERLSPPESAGLFKDQWYLPGINALEAWKITRGARNVTVAILDSGVLTAHEVFQAEGKLTAGFNFANGTADPNPDTSSHGTSCAAVAGAAWEAGRAVGVAPECRIMPIRRSPLGNHLKLAEAFVWAVDHGADIINCSFGIDGRPWVLPDVVRGALDYAVTAGRQGRGCSIFWAAGNGNEPISSDQWASFENVIAVAASTDQGTRAPYSDFGPEVALCAPSSGGINGIATAVNNGYTLQFGGTSAAAPIAAGVAALLLAMAPHMSWREVRQALIRSARQIDPDSGKYDAEGHSVYYGYGQIDARQALLQLDARLEAERAAGLDEAQHDSIDTLLTYLKSRKSGRAILAHLTARRFGILEAQRGSTEFRGALQNLLLFAAGAGKALQAGEPVSIPDGSWANVESVARQVVNLSPLDAPEGAPLAVNPFDLEDTMNGNTQEFDAALDKLAGLFGTGEERDTGTVTVSEQSRARLKDKGKVARQELYLRGMPILDGPRAQELELSVPEVVQLFKTLRRRPSLRRQLLDQGRSRQPEIAAATEGPEGQERLQALAELIGQDLGGDGERFIPALGLALLMATYTVVHQWGR